jgi:hypothetical protein
VFCGSSAGHRTEYSDLARALGREIALRGAELVFGGGKVGLMGILADEVMASGGRAIGIIPEALALKEVAHHGLNELRVVDTMHARKAAMAELADGFIALPGGVGTLEELFEVITWAQLGVHRKPVGLLQVNDYWGPLLAALDHAQAEGFVRDEHRRMLIVEGDPAALLDRFAEYEPPAVPKWLRPDDV